jgi:hypothetical protein
LASPVALELSYAELVSSLCLHFGPGSSCALGPAPNRAPGAAPSALGSEGAALEAGAEEGSQFEAMSAVRALVDDLARVRGGKIRVVDFSTPIVA